jgi:hypothetical protein
MRTMRRVFEGLAMGSLPDFETVGSNEKAQSAARSAPTIYLGFLFTTSHLASTATRANAVDRGKVKGSCRTRKSLFA